MPFDPGRVFKVLRDVAMYPRWWPEIRAVEEIDEDRFAYRVRSALPYWLEFTSQRTIEDNYRGLLEATLDGDLEGFSRWTLAEDGNGCRILFEEEVDLRKRGLNLISAVARPAFKANHSLMLKHGEEGLRRHLAHVG